ncbi:hypothetical protein Acsp06_09700 [Actinomycetospora sp. NBRC 106375]|uniref:serine/threonine-protein kinase n=1 Tax=Actinomycetospora sp. NBRC 106375 TaxID=3032207 RepID=UPI0024A50A94|nr:serine/threonine-protein kinase [Actinomycetospora sp. NBRC 106375]GLZ44785.1 hypothetical protein Acsp06_09700 [Actinomycetospora sp. NBRC 106375]
MTGTSESSGAGAGPPGPSAEMFGPYRLDRRLGRGGMGEVHRAYDTRRDREVALKRLAPELADDTEIRERFERECRTAARLSSPHVVPIHDFGVIDGRLYLDMRLIEGRDLARLLHDDGPLDPVRAVGIVEQVADALDDAHAHDLVHRDVKPGNVLVTTGRGQDFVHLVDFGIVRLGESTTHGRALTGTGTTLGTLAYMAPEQFEGAAVDRRADVYALAVVLHEVLVGRPPFEGDMPAMLHQHLNVAPAPPSSRRPGLGTVLDAVVARGLAKNPSERYGEAGELAEAARAALGGRSGGPVPDPPAGPHPGPEHHRETWVGPSGPPSPPPGQRTPPPQYAGPGYQNPAGPAPSGGHIRWDAGSGTGGTWSPTSPMAPGPGAPGAPGPPGSWGPPGGHPGYGTPEPPKRRRRGLVIGLVAVAVLLVVAVVAVLLVVGRTDSSPAVVAIGPAASLAQTFPDSAGANCLAGDVTAYIVSTTNVRPLAVTQCARGASSIAYIDWETPQDAVARVQSYQSSPSVDGNSTWNLDGVPQGPYYQTNVAGQCTTVAAYTGIRQMVQGYTTTTNCADVTASLNAIGLPGGEDLRAVDRVFPAATRPGCNQATAAAGTSGITPRQVRICGGPEGTTVSFTRWNGPGEVATEANARASRAGGEVTSWSAPGGPRLGPYLRGEDGSTCRALLGWDRAGYGIEVVGTDCDVVDRAVAALAPPPVESLPG